MPAYEGGYQAAPPTARAGSNMPGLILGIVGGALMILGAFLDWVAVGPSKGTTEVPVEFFWDPNVQREPNFVTTGGFVVIVLGLLVILGAALGRGGLARVGAVLGIAAVVLFTISFYRADGGIGDLGIGIWLILAGSVVALVSGFLAPRSRAGTPA